MINRKKNMAMIGMKNAYQDLTNVEKGIAEFLMNNEESTDFSIEKMAEKLYVSKASLTRFAQKCGFRGYREFIYEYEKLFEKRSGVDLNEMTEKVLTIYQTFLDMTLHLIDENQIMRIIKMMTEAKYVYAYGIGSSGITAQEFKLRFMRVGMRIEAISDPHMMKMNSSLVDQDCLIIAFSISGTTKELLSSLRIAEDNHAKIVLITAKRTVRNKDSNYEVLRVASVKNLERGTMITPQFPILVMVDILYIYFCHTDQAGKYAKHEGTLFALTEE